MTGRIVELAVANAEMLALGAGLLPLLRLAGGRRELVARLPLAYAVGVAATGILAAELAVIHVPVGWTVLSVATAASLALGLRRLPPGAGPPRPPLVALALLGVAVAFLVSAARLLAVKPLLESDGWTIWGTRARALYEFGHPVAPVFTSEPYQALQHPLWLPALEALDFRAMGAFDGTLVHLQLLGLAVAFVGGAWQLLRRHASPVLLAAALVAILTAPSFFNQLQTNFADVPLAMLVGLGVAALAAGELPAAALFLGAGAITKNEGEVFALVALAVAALAARRDRLRPLGLTALAVLAIDLPWRIWIQAHHVEIAEYSLSSLFSPGYLWEHRFRVGPSARELFLQLRARGSWSYLPYLVAVGFLCALALRRVRLALFAAGWLGLSFAGLVAIYWISTNPLAHHLENSSDRTIDTLVIGAALLVPVLLHPEDPERGLRDRRVEGG